MSWSADASFLFSKRNQTYLLEGTPSCFNIYIYNIYIHIYIYVCIHIMCILYIHVSIIYVYIYTYLYIYIYMRLKSPSSGPRTLRTRSSICWTQPDPTRWTGEKVGFVHLKEIKILGATADLGPPSSALFTLFLGEGSPTKIDYRRKGAPILTSLLEDLVMGGGFPF